MQKDFRYINHIGCSQGQPWHRKHRRGLRAQASSSEACMEQYWSGATGMVISAGTPV